MRSLVLTLFLASLPVPAQQIDVNDSVLESGRYGTDVVLLSVAYVQQAVLFPDHSKLLQRIAYVETRDGTDQEAFNEGTNGGIWAVKEDAFTSTQIGTGPLLVQMREQIMLTFGINWKAVQWNKLSIPLYSALAAQLVLFAGEGNIPSDTDIMAQGLFWLQNYNADGILQDFINAAKRLEGKFCVCYVVLKVCLLGMFLQ